MRQSKDVISKRQGEILRKVREQGVVYVDDLCQALVMSPVTIRRDLSELESSKLIERFHGGARWLGNVQLEKGDYIQKQAAHSALKKLIAQRAAQLIQDGDTIFISSSTTALLVLNFLQDKKVRIVTNNTLAAVKKRSANIELLLTGGEHSYNRQSLYGEYAANVISKIRATKCILGGNGVDSSHGITTTHYQESPINRQMLEQCSGQKIIVADGSKIGYSDGFVYCNMQDIDVLITDDSADPAELRRIGDQGVDVLLVQTR